MRFAGSFRLEPYHPGPSQPSTPAPGSPLKGPSSTFLFPDLNSDTRQGTIIILYDLSCLYAKGVTVSWRIHRRILVLFLLLCKS